MFLWFGYQTDFGKTEVAKNGLQVTERQAVLKLQGERVPHRIRTPHRKEASWLIRTQ